jgi:lactoylglutathione lyase
MSTAAVTELRLVVTTSDFDAAVHLYRDVLGMAEEPAISSTHGRIAILDAGRATLELSDPEHAAYIDEVEVGRRVAGHIRVAIGVTDADAATTHLVEAGAQLIAPATLTPWGSRNSRLEAAGGLQLTLFEG